MARGKQFETIPVMTLAARRRVRRLPIHGLLVAIDAPGVAEKPWVVDAIDINAHGMGLVLPNELPEGTAVYLSFSFKEGFEFSQMPAVVMHQMGSSGGVCYGTWPQEDRLKLLEFLVQLYETEDE